MATAIKKKAAPKKVAIAKPNNITTRKILEKELKSMGYEIIENKKEDHTETRYLFKLYENDGIIAEFQMTIRALYNCCGVEEVGGFDYAGDGYDIPVGPRLAIIAYALLYVKNNNTVEVGAKRLAEKGYHTAKPIIFTTNGIDTCSAVEKAVTKYLKKEYKIISKTINPSSGNIITTYISVHQKVFVS